MRYVEYRWKIESELLLHREGRTWSELREGLALPYDRPCPSWTKLLEQEIGLIRVKGLGSALVWRLDVKPAR